MKKLVHEKERAIALRKQGLSYNEILQEVQVAKSFLSSWLKDLPLTGDEKAVLKKRKDNNISLGRIRAASELRKNRLDREKVWYQEARHIFEKYKEETLFHAGINLYWAEGAKTGTYWSFINTDLSMIKVMLRWLESYPEIARSEIFFRLYIHRPYADQGCENWWQNKLNVVHDRFLQTCYKETQHKVKNNAGHKGCIRIEVRKSKHLVCKMKFLKELAVEQYLNQ